MEKMPTEMREELKPCERGSGRNLQERARGASGVTAVTNAPDPKETELMEQVVARDNMYQAYLRVMRNKGAAGIDKMTVEELLPHMNRRWEHIKAELLGDRYKPQAVRTVDIPKPNGGIRQLGIPTVTDRMIQQAMLQVLSPYFEDNFSESSYGFRPGRSQHQALKRAQEYAASGKRYVVDLDIEKFFDHVNHDILMSRVARVIEDKRVLRLIRRYLQAGIMIGGVETMREEGTPQGSPLSPLLSNIMLDDLDKELERRGHCFVRYADDCNIYVASPRAGERVMDSISEFLNIKLRLKVNKEKSAVGHISKRTFLGYGMTADKQPRLKVANTSVKRFKDKVRTIFKRSRGRSILQTIADLNPLIRGWREYFKLSKVKASTEELDGWIRHRLRSTQWTHWKKRKRRYAVLVRLGLTPEHARVSTSNGRGSWFNGGARHMNFAMPKPYFTGLGLALVVP
jgi:RNA-directed DNA polymerase